MREYIQATIAMLAVINPMVCGMMLIEYQNPSTVRKNIFEGLKAMGLIFLILVASAIAGPLVLSYYGIGMEAFKIVGGMILGFIGFQMLGPGNTNEEKASKMDFNKVILFGASPGSIAMVMTLAAKHNPNHLLPYIALFGTGMAIILSIATIIPIQLFGKLKGPQIISRFMGLIIICMGIQFLLDGIKDFFFMYPS